MSVDQLLGREREFARVVATLDSSHDGSVLLLVGEPGIGKSALLHAGSHWARSAGMTVVEAAGAEAEMHLPFGAVQQLLSSLPDRIDQLVPVQQNAIRTALGLAGGGAPDLFLIAEAALALLEMERRHQRLIIAVDDLQWLDPQSHQIIAFLAHRAFAARLCVIGTTRADHPSPLESAGFPRLRVQGVDQEVARQLLQKNALGLGSAAVNRILAEAAGNPLALLELPTAWVDEPPADGQPLSLTTRLERAFAGRVAGLPAATRDALLIAAVESSSDAAEIRAALAAFDTDHRSPEVFAPAVRAGLLREVSDTIEFRHSLMRSGVLHKETMGRQLAAHRAISDVLGADEYRRTWHLAWSIVGPDDHVAEELANTVPGSVSRGAAISAVSSLERAAQLTSTSLRRGERLVQAALIGFGAGRADIVARILADVSHLDLSDLDQARVAWLREVLNGDVSSKPTLIRELCSAAIRAHDLKDDGLALNLLMSTALRCWWAESPDDGRSKVIKTLDSFHELRNDPRHVAALALTEPVSRGAEVSDFLVSTDLSAASGDELRTYGMTAYSVGDLPLATDLLDRAERLFREQGRLGLITVVLALQLHIRLELGDWAGAAVAGAEINEVSAATGQPVFADNNVFVEARASALLGQWESSLSQIGEAEVRATSAKINDRVCLAYQARGTALLSANRPQEAFAVLKRQFDPDDVGYHLRESFSSISLMAEAARDCGSEEEARSILRSMEATAVVTPSPLLEVNLLHARAVLAAPAARNELFSVALDHDLQRWPWIRARIQLEYGAWLRHQAFDQEARPLLTEALATFTRIGARRWSSRAAHCLEAQRGVPCWPDLSHGGQP